MERVIAPGVGAAAETSVDCLFPSPALPGSGSMGIISADVVHDVSTPKHDTKVQPPTAIAYQVSVLDVKPWSNLVVC